ncbi:MAG: hypothetical protein JXA21_15470 [Anaerolineae bacterium]|nr:hypothetical protein [Anaerolineae bacterium]
MWTGLHGRRPPTRRRNRQITSFISDPMAGRFLNRPFTYGRDHFRARLPQRGWRAHFDYRVKPRGLTYTGPLVLLIDTYNFSTAENFIVALVDSGRATTVGRPTGGGSGNPISFNLPGGGQARFSTAAFRRNDGSLIEGMGIAPDHYVFWTVEDFCVGRDPDLAAAEQLLFDRLTRDAQEHILPEMVLVKGGSFQWGDEIGD